MGVENTYIYIYIYSGLTSGDRGKNWSEDLHMGERDRGRKGGLPKYMANNVLNLIFRNLIKKLKGERTFHLVAVAVVLLGNERAVKIVKNAWVLKRGALFAPNIDLSTLDNIWLGWCFCINFMYSPVSQTLDIFSIINISIR